MNKVKSIFVMMMMMGMMAISIIAVIRIVNDGFALGYLGALLTTAPFLGLLGSLIVFKSIARTSARLPILTGLAIVGIGFAVVDYVTNAQTLGLVLTFSGAVFFFAYNFWYSELDRAPSSALQIGAPLPDFSLEDVDGNAVPSSHFSGHPWVLLFYRGNWCPLCMAQVKELADDYQKLSDMGTRVALISPQPHGHTRKLASSHDVDFEFLVDAGNAAANQLGIAMKDGVPLGMSLQGYDADTVLPTVVITDASGTIIFLDETDNYRVRPEPATFFKALEQAGVAAHAV